MHLCLTHLQFLRSRGEVCQKESPVTSCYQKGKKPKTTSRWGGVGRVCSAQDCISCFIQKNGNKVRINQRSEKKTYHQVASLFHNRGLGNIVDFHTVSYIKPVRKSVSSENGKAKIQKSLYRTLIWWNVNFVCVPHLGMVECELCTCAPHGHGGM